MGVSGETRASLSGSGDGGDEAYCATCSRSFPMEATHCPDDGTKLVRFKATEDALIGKILDGRYQIQKPLGEGGMGTVYRGMQLSVDREVAIKVVHPSIAAERDAAKRFLREARLSSRLNAPNIVNVYDFGQSDDGVLYLVMELVKGSTLSSVLAANGMLYPPRAANIALQMCDALDAAHSLGIVHRDLKPGNVIVLDDPPGRDLIKVLDFGLAKSVGQDSMSGITNTAALLGTPLYMAPEQIEGVAVDARTDLYALGCMFYELLTGSPPFTDGALSALIAKHLHETPAPLPDHVPAPIADVVMRLLAKKPADRFPTAPALREALHRALAQTPAGGVPILRSSSPIIRGASAAMPAHAPITPTSIAFAPTSAVSIDAGPKPRRRVAVIGGVAVLATIIGIVVVMASGSDDKTGTPVEATPIKVETTPTGTTPTGTTPTGTTPTGTTPTGTTPTGTTPTGTTPTGTTPTGTTPTGTTPTGTTLTGTTPTGTTLPVPAGSVTIATPTTETKPTGTKPTGTMPTGTRPTGTKPTGTKPTGTKPTGTKPTGTKPTGTKPTGTKPTGTKPLKDPGGEELPFLTPK